MTIKYVTTEQIHPNSPWGALGPRVAGRKTYLSHWSSTNSVGANFKHGWEAFASAAQAEAHQLDLPPSHRDGIEIRDDVEPGEEWSGS